MSLYAKASYAVVDDRKLSRILMILLASKGLRFTYYGIPYLIAKKRFKPSLYPISICEHLEVLDSKFYKKTTHNVESVFRGYNTESLIELVAHGIADVQLTALSVLPIRFSSQEVISDDKNLQMIIVADPKRDPLLRLEKFDYYFLQLAFSVQHSDNYTDEDVSRIELTLDLAGQSNVWSFFPTTEVVALTARSTSLNIGIGADCKFGVSGSIPAESAKVSADSKTSASMKWAWKSSYSVIGNPIIASRKEHGVKWVFNKIDSVQDASQIAKAQPVLGGNDIQLMMVVGVPKGSDKMDVTTRFQVWCEDAKSVPRELSLTIPMCSTR